MLHPFVLVLLHLDSLVVIGVSGKLTNNEPDAVYADIFVENAEVSNVIFGKTNAIITQDGNRHLAQQPLQVVITYLFVTVTVLLN